MQGRRQGHKTTVYKLLSAGWLPHFRVFVWGCLCLGAGVDDERRPHSTSEDSPTGALPPTLLSCSVKGSS